MNDWILEIKNKNKNKTNTCLPAHHSARSLRFCCYGIFREIYQNVTSSILFNFENKGRGELQGSLLYRQQEIMQAREVLAGDRVSMV